MIYNHILDENADLNNPAITTSLNTQTHSANIKHWIKERITEDGFVRRSTHPHLFTHLEDSFEWLLDIRSLSLNPIFLERTASLFWNEYKDLTECQIGGVETSSIPFITAFVLEGKRRGINVSGFYIRKSRKKQGLKRHIEGMLGNAPIILVDDLINSGQSFEKQIKVLEKEGKSVESLFALVRFRPLETYRGITRYTQKIRSLFTLEDFSIPLITQAKNKSWTFIQRSYFKSKQYVHTQVLSKSPLLPTDNNRLYFGADNGHVWCLDSLTLQVIWHTKLGLFSRHHFFTPLFLSESSLFATSHKGTLFQLDSNTGKLLNRFSIGTSAFSAPLQIENKYLIVAANEMRGGMIHIIDSHDEIIIDSIPTKNPIKGSGAAVAGTFYYVDTAGNIIAGTKRGLSCYHEIATGPSEGGVLFDKITESLVWGTMGGNLYTAPLRTLVPKKLFTADAGFMNIPALTSNAIVAASLDTNIYCLERSTGNMRWKFTTRGRIFAAPIVHKDIAFVGCNDGRFYAINMHNGKEICSHQVTERILSQAVICNDTSLAFTTFENEVYLVSMNLEQASNAQ